MPDDLDPIRRFRDEVPNPDGASWATARAALAHAMHPAEQATRTIPRRGSRTARVHRWRPLALIAVLLLGGSAAGIAVADSLSPASIGNRVLPDVGAIDPTITATLGVFRRPEASSDVPPTATVKAAGFIVEHFGANPALSRLALVTSQGIPVYLSPAQDGACLFDSTGSSALCATTAQIQAGQATGGDGCSPDLPSDQVEIAGIVPDGAKNATLTLSNGTTEPLAVKNNVYIVRTDRSAPLPTTVQWTTADGPQSVEAPLGPGTATTDCITAQQRGALESRLRSARSSRKR